jgi:hypothetical protein
MGFVVSYRAEPIPSGWEQAYADKYGIGQLLS